MGLYLSIRRKTPNLTKKVKIFLAATFRAIKRGRSGGARHSVRAAVANPDASIVIRRRAADCAPYPRFGRVTGQPEGRPASLSPPPASRCVCGLAKLWIIDISQLYPWVKPKLFSVQDNESKQGFLDVVFSILHPTIVVCWFAGHFQMPPPIPRHWTLWGSRI